MKVVHTGAMKSETIPSESFLITGGNGCDYFRGLEGVKVPFPQHRPTIERGVSEERCVYDRNRCGNPLRDKGFSCQ